MAKELAEFGKTRVYGINFDSDSDHIKDESFPTLNKIVAVLKAKPDWKLNIEGHTDSTATPTHNQQLSERRAKAVRAYLESVGVAPGRLSSAGFGATRPVAPNETAIGRAQNRRVELTKM
jgi:outer membrane protein OmpA-like peptidoglycan-associated protein